MTSIWDGAAEIPGRVTVLDAAGGELAARAAAVPHGASSITDLIEREPFVLAHRCGRLDWAEYSLRGATESVLRRVDGLEVSVALTSDGVWFGLHDRTLLRTSGVDVDPTTITWAEVLAHPNMAPAGGDPSFGDQPYARIEELLTYATSHVIFLDLKYQAGEPSRDGLLDIVEDLIPDAPSRIVIKFADGSATPVADWATSRGYQSWGHFRQSQYDADPAGVVADAAAWTMIGLEPAGSVELWDAMAGLDKILIGAVVDDQADLGTVLDKGASGAVIGGVRAIQGLPVI